MGGLGALPPSAFGRSPRGIFNEKEAGEAAGAGRLSGRSRGWGVEKGPDLIGRVGGGQPGGIQAQAIGPRDFAAMGVRTQMCGGPGGVALRGLGREPGFGPIAVAPFVKVCLKPDPGDVRAGGFETVGDALIYARSFGSSTFQTLTKMSPGPVSVMTAAKTAAPMSMVLWLWKRLQADLCSRTWPGVILPIAGGPMRRTSGTSACLRRWLVECKWR